MKRRGLCREVANPGSDEDSAQIVDLNSQAPNHNPKCPSTQSPDHHVGYGLRLGWGGTNRGICSRVERDPLRDNPKPQTQEPKP